jgi:hypothetical protein
LLPRTPIRRDLTVAVVKKSVATPTEVIIQVMKSTQLELKLASGFEALMSAKTFAN